MATKELLKGVKVLPFAVREEAIKLAIRTAVAKAEAEARRTAVCLPFRIPMGTQYRRKSLLLQKII